MQSIQSSDNCAICMDETSRDFLYKTCCTLLLCRKCYNQLEVESFPNHSTCPGCRQGFSQVGYSIDLVDDTIVPRAYCGQPLPHIKSLKEHDAHVLTCVECLKKVIKGNSWFEKQLTEKFAGIKRKLQSVEDEVYVRNNVIRNLSTQNAYLAREVERQAETIQRLSAASAPSELLDSMSTSSGTEMLSTTPDASSSEEDLENLPPASFRTPPTAAARTRAPIMSRRRVQVARTQSQSPGAAQEATASTTTTAAQGATETLRRSRRVLQFTVDSIE